jgi:hypothetical protein
MTVQQLLDNVSSSEITEWIAFMEMELFDQVRSDYRMAVNTAVLANVNRTDKKQKVFEPKDFMPNFEETIEKNKNDTPEELAKKMNAIANMFGIKEEVK